MKTVMVKMSSSYRIPVIRIRRLDPFFFYFGQPDPDPDPFHETDLGSKKSAKIMENFHQNNKMS